MLHRWQELGMVGWRPAGVAPIPCVLSSAHGDDLKCESKIQNRIVMWDAIQANGLLMEKKSPFVGLQWIP